MIPTNEHIYAYIKNRLIDYVTCKPDCDLMWIKRKIRSSGISKSDLANIFIELEDYVPRDEFKIIFKICRDAKFDYNALK